MKTKQQRKEEAYKEYRKICNSAWKEYDKIIDPALKKYQKITTPALKEYEKKIKEIDNEAKKICSKCGQDLK